MSDLPARWLVDHRHLLPRSGRALDVACGRGRHAVWLAEQGFDTLGIDRDPEAIAAVNAAASRRGLPLRGVAADLEQGGLPLRTSVFDVVVVVHYLHRSLLPALREVVRPGGLLIYETFTRAQAERGKPANPDFLLEPGELRELVQPFEVLVEREGDFEGKMLASVIARRPPALAPP